MPKVAITHNSNIELAISEALKHIEVEEIIRDKVVALKPNETWASKDDLTAVTQGDTLRAVLRFLKKRAPKKLDRYRRSGCRRDGRDSSRKRDDESHWGGRRGVLRSQPSAI